MEPWLYPDGSLAGNDGWTTPGESVEVASHRATGALSSDGDVSNDAAAANLDRTKPWDLSFNFTLEQIAAENSFTVAIGEDGNNVYLSIGWRSVSPTQFTANLIDQGPVTLADVRGTPHSCRIAWADNVVSAEIDGVVVMTKALTPGDWGDGPVAMNATTFNNAYFIGTMRLRGSSL